MTTTLSFPCNEYPFRRKAAPGWLGRNSPEEFAALAFSDESVPCHQTIDYSLPSDEIREQEEAAPRCRGALQLQKNSCKLSRNWAIADLVKSLTPDHEAVFSFPREFIEYHNTANVKSWEIIRDQFLYFEDNQPQKPKVIVGRLCGYNDNGEPIIQLTDHLVRAMPLWLTIYRLIPSPTGIQVEVFQEGDLIPSHVHPLYAQSLQSEEKD